MYSGLTKGGWTVSKAITTKSLLHKKIRPRKTKRSRGPAPGETVPDAYPHSIVTSGIVKMEQMIDRKVHCIMGRASLPY